MNVIYDHLVSKEDNLSSTNRLVITGMNPFSVQLNSNMVTPTDDIRTTQEEADIDRTSAYGDCFAWCNWYQIH